MADTGASRTPGTRLARLRRPLGWLVAAATVVAGALFAAAMWNPWRLVVLDRYFGNPLLGVVLVCAGAYLAMWFLAPVQNEAAQSGRLRIRTPVLVIGAVGLFAWALLGDVFNASYEELARSNDEQRAVALVTRSSDERQIVRVWVGTGLLTRDAGEIGHACGSVSAEFVSDELIELDAGYGGWQIDLDPETAEPLQVLGPRCPDGPQPAQ